VISMRGGLHISEEALRQILLILLVGHMLFS
jgi:hypothetical protein